MVDFRARLGTCRPIFTAPSKREMDFSYDPVEGGAIFKRALEEEASVKTTWAREDRSKR